MASWKLSKRERKYKLEKNLLKNIKKVRKSAH